jgi:hypothetical protein
MLFKEAMNELQLLDYSCKNSSKNNVFVSYVKTYYNAHNDNVLI